MIKKSSLNIIIDLIKDQKLKKIASNYLLEDSWKEDLKALSKESFINDLNETDQIISYCFQLKKLSLLYRYKECYSIILIVISLLEKTSVKAVNKTLNAYASHIIAISLAYMGKLKSDQFKKYYSTAYDFYEKSGLINDLNQLKIELLDIKNYYEDDYSKESILKEAYSLNNTIKSDYQKNEVLFRLGILNLFNYINNKSWDSLIKANESFEDYLKNIDSDNYKSYWAKCGILVTNFYQNKPIDDLFMDISIPKGSYSKAKGFPLILFLIARAHIISGKENKVRKIFFNIERRIENLLNEFPDNLDYQKIIINRYGFLLEEWINYNFYDKNSSILEKSINIIHINELLVNRLLFKDHFTNSLSKEGLFEAENKIQKFINKKNGLIYFTIKLKNLNNNYVQRVIVINSLEKDGIKIIELESDDLLKIKKDFTLTFFRESSLEEQNIVLDKYGSHFSELISYSNKELYNVISNGFYSYLPIDMARYKKQYLYERIIFNYQPNLSLQKNKKFKRKSNLAVFYTTNEKLSIIEANNLKKKYGAALFPDPDLKDFKLIRKYTMVHIISHHKSGNLIFKNKNIPLKEILINYTSSNTLSSFNICNSFSKSDLQENYFAYSKSLANHILKNGVNEVITHSWELSQKAGLILLNDIYEKNKKLKFKNFKPSEYGGYMFWRSL